MGAVTRGTAPDALRMGTTRGRWVLLATVLGSSLATLDSTVVNVALERIGSDLDAGFSGLQWTINAYTLTLASLILLGGSLSDRFGRRRIFVLGTVWFAVASLLCGLAPNIEALIAARALQGVGGALLTPGSLAIISASFVGVERAAAVGAWSGLSGVAAAVGPFVGGWLVDWSWRAVFLINLPLAVAVVLVAVRHVPESRDPDAAPVLDWQGTIAVSVGLAGLTYALTYASEGMSWTVVAIGLVGVVSLALFVYLELHCPHPLVPPKLFADRQFTATNGVTLLVYAAIGAFFVLVVLQLQVVAGMSPLVSGTVLLPITVLMLLFSARVGALAQRFGPRLFMTVGPLVIAAGVLLLRGVDADASYVGDVLPGAVVFGIGATLTVAPLTATVLASAPDRWAGVASAVNNAVARAAGLLAVALVPVLAGIGGEDYTDPVSFDAGYRSAMLVCAGLLVGGGVLALFTIRRPLAATTEPSPDDERVPLERCPQCGVGGPQLHPPQHQH
jgi:EmrB/QacA subfamily drug resistance transporter